MERAEVKSMKEITLKRRVEDLVTRSGECAYVNLQTGVSCGLKRYLR